MGPPNSSWVYTISIHNINKLIALNTRTPPSSSRPQVYHCHTSDPEYRWSIQCYHYVTTGSGKNRKRKRVNTHRAVLEDILPCADLSDKFVPDTQNRFVQVRTALKMDFAASNYLQRFEAWKQHHWRDTHADFGHTESLGKPGEDFLAVWVLGDGSWRASPDMLRCLNVVGLGMFYRVWIEMQTRIHEAPYLKKAKDVGAGY